MRKTLFCSSAVIALSFALAAASQTGLAQDSQSQRSTIAQSLKPPALSQSRVDRGLIEFPLPKGAQAYGAIDGRKMHKFVEELANISKRYRDNGHPQFWGRIIGTSSDTETTEWLAGKFRTLGLSDVRIQPLALPPQWIPQSWDVTMTGGGKTIKLSSSQPAYYANGLPNGGVELDAVYAGLGTEADFAGKDVRGKAVFIYAMQGLQDQGGVKRADDKGAAVVFEVSMLPGNMHYLAYPSGTKAPEFVLGNDDGTTARQMIEAAKTGPAPKVKVTLNVEKVPNLKTALVWGTLPGATDETIYITAHKDGWFEGAGDNGGGVAVMLGLAEYYAKIPQAQRKRTIIFIGLDGHHNGPGGAVGKTWLTQNKATLFAKTAMLINSEHPSTITTQSRPRYYPGDELAWGNTYMPMQWYAGGKDRPELRKIVWDSFRKFGVPLEFDPSPTPPASDASYFYRFTPAVDASEYHNYFHTDWETPEAVPWTGLEAAARAYANVIDEVNKRPLSAFKRPDDPKPGQYDE
ncbi:MAG: M28 family peptidase [Rhizomicrobium sp.]